MTFDEMLATGNGDHYQVAPGWGQGRASFGGLVAALLLHRLQAALPGRVLRSLTVSFVGPVAPGPVIITAEVLRQGRSVTQALARLTQDGAVQAVLLASFGEPRTSALQVQADAAANYGPPESGRQLVWVPGVLPDFIQYVDFRWHEGGFPFSGAKLGNFGGYVRLQPGQASGAMTLPHLVALVDTWPPAATSLLSTIAPMSSLTWTLEVVGDFGGLAAGDWVRYRAETQHAADGYAHAEARCWDEHGRLLAISRQTVVVFA